MGDAESGGEMNVTPKMLADSFCRCIEERSPKANGVQRIFVAVIQSAIFSAAGLNDEIKGRGQREKDVYSGRSCLMGPDCAEMAEFSGIDACWLRERSAKFISAIDEMKKKAGDK